MNICLTSINKKTYSETFIQAQIDNLPVNLVLHSEGKPLFYDENSRISPKVLTLVEKGLKKIFNKNYSFITDYFYLRLLKKRKIDVVLAQYGIGGVYMLPICQKSKCPLVVHFHGYDASYKPILDYYEKEYQKLFKDASAIIAVSKKMTDMLVDLGCNRNKIFLAACAPHNSFLELTPRYESKIFLAVGRFVDKKAPYLTILAFKEVLKEVPDTTLVMVGDGVLMNTCKNIAKGYNLENAISFVGILDRHQIQAYMSSALAFVQHSKVTDKGDSEGTPVAILEAQAAGLPVISTFHAGIPDIVIDGETGYLVEEGDILGMAQAMIKLLKNRELVKTMGAKAKERIKNHFTMQLYTNKLKEALSYGINSKNHI
jgi:colanic acid/amylovoran biosynthesis glycosyltransferase